jgi:hypothetical protein
MMLALFPLTAQPSHDLPQRGRHPLELRKARSTASTNGSIGTGRVARAAPDGYTLVVGIWNTHVANAAIYALQYDVVKDFEPVLLLADAPLLSFRFGLAYFRPGARRRTSSASSIPRP